jgi:hypothetical protein
MTKIVEGEVASDRSSVDYPEIDSCMSITSVLSTGVLVGGHMVQVPRAGQKTPLQVAEAIVIEEGKQGGERMFLICVGARKTWSGSQMNPIYEALQEADADKIIDLDTTSLGTVDVAVNILGSIKVLKKGMVQKSLEFKSPSAK